MNKDFGFQTSRAFYIRSRMPSGRVIEVVGGRNLVLKTVKREREVQQFFFDGITKTLKSQQYKDRSIDIMNGGRSNNL